MGLAEHGLIKGERIGVDASTMEANAALRMIVLRDTGEGYREMLTRMAKESGIETPTAEDLSLDRNRTGKTLSNAEWQSPTDPDAKIAKLKDGRTRLQARACDGPRYRRGYSAEVQAADRGARRPCHTLAHSGRASRGGGRGTDAPVPAD